MIKRTEYVTRLVLCVLAVFLTAILFLFLCEYLAGLYGSNALGLCLGVSGLSPAGLQASACLGIQIFLTHFDKAV